MIYFGMVHKDHVYLIKKAITNTGETWADLGSGSGAFTLALRDVGGSDMQIYSIDQDQHRLWEQESEFKHKFPNSNIKFITSDFTKPRELPQLDGILMANSLHYIKDQVSHLNKLKSYLKPTGKLVIVEYNTDQGNMWVPYALSYQKFERIALQAGYRNVELLATVPLEWGHEMYAAQALV